MLRNATPRSLLVIDEFGKGTESNDGAGLFCGVVQSLLGLGRATVSVPEDPSLCHRLIVCILSNSLALSSLLTSSVSLVGRRF